MSWHDYEISSRLVANKENTPRSLLMAAMRRAETDDDFEVLIAAFPSVWEEICKRIGAPYGDGLLPGEEM